jgi:hypothetical protein
LSQVRGEDAEGRAGIEQIDLIDQIERIEIIGEGIISLGQKIEVDDVGEEGATVVLLVNEQNLFNS